MMLQVMLVMGKDSSDMETTEESMRPYIKLDKLEVGHLITTTEPLALLSLPTPILRKERLRARGAP